MFFLQSSRTVFWNTLIHLSLKKYAESWNDFPLLIYPFITKQRKYCCSPQRLDTPNGIVLCVIQSHNELNSQIWSYFSLLSCEGGPPIAQIFNMFCVSSSHKSCKYREGTTQSEEDLGNKCEASACAALPRVLTRLYILGINICNLLAQIKQRSQNILAHCVMFLVDGNFTVSSCVQ